MMKRTLFGGLCAAALLVASPLFAAGNGADAGVGCALTLPPPTAAVLSDSERSELLRMREEEKMARDLYLHFYDLWGLRPFSNIAVAEQTHMDRMLEHLVAQGLEDPASAESGRFNLAEIQSLYDTLAERGTASAEEALGAAAYVEEIDILDLQRAVSSTADPDQRLSYVNLMLGSYKHLQAFVRQLAQRGVAYAAQLLPQEQVDWILAGTFSPDGRVALGIGGTPSTSCFVPLLIAGDGRSGDGLVLSDEDTLSLVIELFPEAGHVGLSAELLVVVMAGDGALMLDEQGRWRAWDGMVSNLMPLRRVEALASRERLSIHDGPVAALGGEFVVYAGYLLGEGSVVSSQPVVFSVR